MTFNNLIYHDIVPKYNVHIHAKNRQSFTIESIACFIIKYINDTYLKLPETTMVAIIILGLLDPKLKWIQCLQQQQGTPAECSKPVGYSISDWLGNILKQIILYFRNKISKEQYTSFSFNLVLAAFPFIYYLGQNIIRPCYFYNIKNMTSNLILMEKGVNLEL